MACTSYHKGYMIYSLSDFQTVNMEKDLVPCIIVAIFPIGITGWILFWVSSKCIYLLDIIFREVRKNSFEVWS